MSKNEYTTVTDSEEIGVVGGIVEMDENREPIPDTFMPIAVTRFDRSSFCSLIAAETYLTPPIEDDRVYTWFAAKLRAMADDIEGFAQERR